ncbi:MAG: c-type cytochrome [Pseudomonadota bacterium]
MKQNWVTTIALSSAVCGLTVWLASRSATGAPPAAPNQRTISASTAAPPVDAERARVARGEHLVLSSGCNDCHTPLKMGKNGPEPDMSRMLSGHPERMKLPPPPAASMPWLVTTAATNTAWAGPWGVSFTANLTPDVETGLGGWSQEEFAQAIKSGRHRGRGRPVLPPMPIPAYRNFTDDELAAIFTYLRSIPALKNRVPEPLPPAAPKGAHG